MSLKLRHYSLEPIDFATIVIIFDPQKSSIGSIFVLKKLLEVYFSLCSRSLDLNLHTQISIDDKLFQNYLFFFISDTDRYIKS